MDFLKPISIAEEPVLTIGLLLLLTIIVPLLFRQIKITGIVGLILAGAVFGPNGLNFLEAQGVIDVLGIIGLLYLMFIAGLEMNLDRFKEERNNVFVFGILTFLVPMICGTVIFTWFGFSLPASLLIASMFASHTLVTYPIIMRLNLTKEKSVSSAVGATVITDTAALLVLAVVARSVDGELGVAFWLTLICLFVLYLAFMFFLLPRISYQFFSYVDDSGRYTYVYVIGTMLVCSWLAHIIGIEAILGAFLSGLAFNRLLTHKGVLKNRIYFFGDAFFIPLFLIYVGMQVDFGIFFSDSFAWVIMGLMLATGVITKWLSAFFSGKILNFTMDQIWVMFGMSVTEGAATLAAVFIGFDLGIFGEEVLNGAILLILVTCLIGPMLVEKYGLRLTDTTTYELEQGIDTERRILVPLSNPHTSAKLIELAANLCSSEKNSAIYPLSVLNSVKNHVAQRERSDKILEMASGQIHAVNLRAHPVLEKNLNVAEGIAGAAKKYSATDIVIGWNGEISTKVKVFGNIVDQLISSTDQQIFVCKYNLPISAFQNIKIVVSPGMVNQKYFKRLFGTILQLAQNLNNRVQIYCLQNEQPFLLRNYKLPNETLEVNLKEFAEFDLLLEDIFNELDPTDLLIVTNLYGNYGWALGTNTIPRRIAYKKPDYNFIVAYPSREKEEHGSQTDLIYSN